MLDDARSTLQETLNSHPWLPELAGLLPMSALLEFVDTAKKLHIFQLVGEVPLWSWPITPAGSRVLLSTNDGADSCHLDAFGNSISWMATDGRYGDHYNVPNSETLRIWLSTEKPHVLHNCHENMKITEQRVHDLEVIRVTKASLSGLDLSSFSSLVRYLPGELSSVKTLRFLMVSLVGWIVLFVCIILAVLLKCFTGVVFLILVPITGLFVFLLHGNRPRTPIRQGFGMSDRIIVVYDHPNSTNWKIFCGKGGVINSILNLPLKARRERLAPTLERPVRIALRVLIIGQWAIMLASASLKNWNSIIICFWITLCIATHAYLLPPTVGVQCWAKSYAGISFERYQIKLSSRRAVLNTIMALNLDTVPWSKKNLAPAPVQKWLDGAMTWIDPVLKQCPDRTRWEKASREALTQSAKHFSIEQLASADLISAVWQSDRLTWHIEYEKSDDYWLRHIIEGIFVAAKIKIAAKLSEEDRVTI